MESYDVVIIGAGTAGLTARREVAKVTDNYLIVDDGPLGTTCARVGCMPSKALIQVANDIHQAEKLKTMNLIPGATLPVDRKAVMAHVRKLRDRFVRSVKEPMKDWQDRFVSDRAQFLSPNTLRIGDKEVEAKKVIIATGSSPIVPKAWQPFAEALITTDRFFELEELPKTMAVIGLGVIGFELGQALKKLGVEVVGVTKGKSLAGLSDPQLQNYVYEKIKSEFPVSLEGVESLERTPQNQLCVKTGGQEYQVEAALLAMGRAPNIRGMGLENIGVSLNERGLPEVDKNTMKLKEAPHIFLPGDVNADRPLLHEAADEGLIAGHNAVHEEQCFKRRTFLGITFSEPNIATVGQSHSSLCDQDVDFVTGEVSFEGQGRSIVKLKEQGLLHVYVDAKSQKILGAELQAPDGEHIAHLLAWAISLELTVEEALRLPFYHPVVEEGLRTALRHALSQVSEKAHLELFRCTDPPIR